MRVKLEDVCERGTSSLMQKDIVDKNGKYPVYGASGRIGSMETYQQEDGSIAVPDVLQPYMGGLNVIAKEE